MSVIVSTLGHSSTAKCDAANKSCTKEATLSAGIGEMTSVALCISCARELFNALGFIVMSQTGDSIERLAGLKKRRGDRK